MSIQSILRPYQTARNSNAFDTILDLHGSEPLFTPQRVNKE